MGDSTTTREPFTGEIGPSMAEFSDEYMTYVEDHLADDLAEVPERILAMLRSMRGLMQGFQIDQLENCLQTATRAERAGADIDMVVASLCHDMGKTISNANHPAIAAEMIRPFVRDDVYYAIKYHQDFQGKHYYQHFGKPQDLRDQYRDEPWFALAEQFADEWDQAAFDPDYDTLPLEHFEPLVREITAMPKSF